MRTRTVFPFAALLLLALFLAIAPAALAADQAYPAVAVSGAVIFAHDGTRAVSSFEANAIGPAAPGDDHQPARGFLVYRDASGLSFRVNIEHIHAHSANEVHFGGMIVHASDPALIGKHAHVVAVDNGPRGDLFSVLVTAEDTHEHAEPAPFRSGNLVTRVR